MSRIKESFPYRSGVRFIVKMKHDPFTDKKIKSKGLGLVLILALAGLWTGLNQGQCSGLKPNFIVILVDSPFQGEVFS